MKHLILLICLSISVPTFAQQKSKPKTSAYKDKDGIDGRMKGPNGETIYIGEKGGRYYLKNGNKVYVEYNGNKDKKTKKTIEKILDKATK